MNSSKITQYSQDNKIFPFLKKSALHLTLGVGVVSLWHMGNNLMQSWQNLFPRIENQVDVSSVIVQKIQGVSELTTTIFTMDAVVPTSSERKIMGEMVIGKTNLLYLARGEVKAGLDLSQISPSDITVSENTIKIKLPAPLILDSKIDVNRSQVYEYNRGFLSLGPDVAPTLYSQAQQESLLKVQETACQEGILTQANQRAEITVKALLEGAGYDNTEVETTEPKTCRG